MTRRQEEEQMIDETETGVPARPITRRGFLQGSAMAGFGAFLAACTGGQSPSPAGSVVVPTPPSQAPSPSASPTPKVITGPLHWAQWPAYIDLTGKAGEEGAYKAGSSPTIEQFKKKYKVDVNYEEKIEANEDFYATIQQQLVAGLATGWDIITVTDWLAAKIISKGWAEQIDQTNVPNCAANLRDALRNQTWDPKQDYHYPWQSGMTGIGYNKKTLAKNGKAEPRSVEDMQAVHDDIKPLAEKGLRFTGNEYLQDFASKKVWAAMTWSGDLASSGSEDDVWVAPTEGSMVWTDNMVIPKGAVNKYTAELMMDFCYDPKIAAQIAYYVYYVSPVKGAAEEIAKLDKEAAKNPLLFPPDDVVAKQHNFQFLTDELEQKMNELYSDMSGT